MAKKTTTEAQVISWKDMAAGDSIDGLALANQIMNVMEQGIIVWTADGTCELHNTRIIDVLELERDALSIGTRRDTFLQRAYERGEFDSEKLADIQRRFGTRVPFQFDRTLPSGRVVATYARPTREGGYVVTSTDVTEARKAARELEVAKKKAEDAEAQAREILQEERARRAEARTLSDLDEWLQSCKSLSELYMVLGKFMGRLIPQSRGEMYLYSNSRDVLDGVCEWGQDGAMHDHIAPDACWSLRRGRLYEYNPDALCFPCDHVSEESAAADYICIPVIAHGDTVGMMHIAFDPKMSRSDVKIMGRFAGKCAEHVSMAVANVKLRDELHDQSIRDPLTGLFNRRYFMDAMRREEAASDKAQTGYALISLDADHFKMFNDNHGHEAGDLVLRAIAEKMWAVMPERAVCARIGGEEFAVLLPLCDLDGAAAEAESLRSAVAAMEVRTAFGMLPPVTISVGVAAYLCDKTPPSAVVKQADEALFCAKNGGRNRVEKAAHRAS